MVLLTVSLQRSESLDTLDSLYSNTIRNDALSVVRELWSFVTVSKRELYVDVLTESSRVLTRDFPKSTDGSMPSSPQKIQGTKHLESLITVVSKRKMSMKGQRTLSILCFSLEKFDTLELDCDTPSALQPNCLFLIMAPATSAHTHAASTEAVHACLHNLRSVFKDGDTNAEGTSAHPTYGIHSVLNSMKQRNTSFASLSLLYMLQEYSGTLPVGSNTLFLDMFLEEYASEKNVGDDVSVLAAELTVAQQRIKKLETLLKLKSLGSASSEAALFQQLSDTAGALDISRERVRQLEVKRRHVPRILKAPQKWCVDQGTNTEEVPDTSKFGDPKTAEPLFAIELSLPRAQVFYHTEVVGDAQLESLEGMEGDISSSTSSDVSDHDTDAGTSTSSLEHTPSSSMSSTDDDTLNSANRNASMTVSLCDVEEDIISAQRRRRPRVKLLRWKWCGNTERSRLKNVLRRILRSNEQQDAVSAVAIEDLAQILDAAFVSSMHSTSDLTTICAHFPNMCSSTTTHDGNDLLDLPANRRQWINSPLALAMRLNPLHDSTFPKVQRIQLMEAGNHRVGQRIRVAVTLTHNAAHGNAHRYPSRLRWYRRSPHDPRGTLVHDGTLSDRRNSTVSYLVSVNDVGSYIVCEVVPRHCKSGVWGAAASVSTSTVVIPSAASMPRLCQVYISMPASSNVATPPAPVTSVSAPDLVQVTLVYDDAAAASRNVGARARIRWYAVPCAAHGNSDASPRFLVLETFTPYTMLPIPAACCGHLLCVEVTPFVGASAVTMTSLAVPVTSRSIVAPRVPLNTFSTDSGLRFVLRSSDGPPWCDVVKQLRIVADITHCNRCKKDPSTVRDQAAEADLVIAIKDWLNQILDVTPPPPPPPPATFVRTTIELRSTGISMVYKDANVDVAWSAVRRLESIVFPQCLSMDNNKTVNRLSSCILMSSTMNSFCDTVVAFDTFDAAQTFLTAATEAWNNHHGR